jgi:hypothetical protein
MHKSGSERILIFALVYFAVKFANDMVPGGLNLL